MLTHSVNLALGLNRASNINVGLGTGSGLLFRARAGFGLQNEAHFHIWSGTFTFFLCRIRKPWRRHSGAASLRFWEGPIVLTSRKQQYYVWDTASRSTKREDMQEIWGVNGPFGPPCLLLCAEWRWPICCGKRSGVMTNCVEAKHHNGIVMTQLNLWYFA